MLPKARRLTTRDFKSLRRGRTVNTAHLALRVFPAGAGGKVSVVVSSSSYKRAVDRNLLRRRLYAIIEAHATKLQGRTLIVTARKGALGIPFSALKEEFLGALGQA